MERASIQMPPPASVHTQEVQVALLDWQMLTLKDQEISQLKASIEER